KYDKTRPGLAGEGHGSESGSEGLGAVNCRTEADDGARSTFRVGAVPPGSAGPPSLVWGPAGAAPSPPAGGAQVSEHASRPRYHGIPRSDPAMVLEVWAAVRASTAPPAPSAWRQVALG